MDKIDILDEIRMVSLLDIGAMKLNAIYNSGKRLKDFVDMYSLLEKYSLNQLLDACQRKYSDLNINIVKNSLMHHADIIFSPIEFMGAEVKWPIIAERLKNAFHNPNITFGLPENVRKIMEKDKTNKKGNSNRPKR